MNIDSDPEILERQMQEVLTPIGVRIPVADYVLPADCDLPPSEHECDMHFHLGEAYLIGNQAPLAIYRFNKALAAFDGHSQYENFPVAVRL